MLFQFGLPHLKNLSLVNLFQFLDCFHSPGLSSLLTSDCTQSFARYCKSLAGSKLPNTAPCPQPRSLLVCCLILHWGFVHLQKKNPKANHKSGRSSSSSSGLRVPSCAALGPGRVTFPQAEGEGRRCADVGQKPSKEGRSAERSWM